MAMQLSTSMATRDLAELDDWTIAEISNRQKWLIEMFNIIWSPDAPDLSGLVLYRTWKALPKAH